MFGQLDLSAIPYGNPIIVGALGISAVLTVAVMALITHLRKWNYLWTEWLAPSITSGSASCTSCFRC